MRTEARQFLDQANAFTLQRRFADAIPLYQRAIEADPADPRGFHQLGCMLYAAGQIAEARGVLDLGLSALPASPLLHWARCMATLPAIYADNTEIETVRAEFSGRLAALESVCLANLPEAAEAAGSMSPFFLAYQGRNDIAPMRIFGTLSCRIMAAAAPSFATRPMPRWQPGERIRVGFVCGLFFRHAVWRMPVRGWAENLDRSRFELTGYHTRPERDAQTDLAAGLFGRFDRTPRSALAWAASIAHDAPHVLIYPELGADQTSQQLAALRLAPVQCTTWGQPVTSGMPTMDYYLSSDLMEPACGQDHYTERLVRLPGLGIVCQADYAAWGAPLPRNDIWTGLDLPGGAVRFICCQSLPKYLPDFDDLYPRIAAALPAARFLFVATDRNHAAVLHRRLQAAFARHGLAADTFVRFAGTQSPEGFSAMIRDADVFLDTPVWSGCNTTFDAAGHGIPVVTLPGTTMRGRHSLAILSAAGVTETVASSLDDYAEIAVHLGRNEHWRRAVAARLRAARPRIFGDTRPVRALEDFLTAAVAAASQG